MCALGGGSSWFKTFRLSFHAVRLISWVLQEKPWGMRWNSHQSAGGCVVCTFRGNGDEDVESRATINTCDQSHEKRGHVVRGHCNELCLVDRQACNSGGVPPYPSWDLVMRVCIGGILYNSTRKPFGPLLVHPGCGAETVTSQRHKQETEPHSVQQQAKQEHRRPHTASGPRFK